MKFGFFVDKNNIMYYDTAICSSSYTACDIQVMAVQPMGKVRNCLAFLLKRERTYININTLPFGNVYL